MERFSETGSGMRVGPVSRASRRQDWARPQTACCMRSRTWRPSRGVLDRTTAAGVVRPAARERERWRATFFAAPAVRSNVQRSISICARRAAVATASHIGVRIAAMRPSRLNWCPVPPEDLRLLTSVTVPILLSPTLAAARAVPDLPRQSCRRERHPRSARGVRRTGGRCRAEHSDRARVCPDRPSSSDIGCAGSRA
jgi:hypothetical protein